ncbi:MAG: hypothetical protein DME73_01490 [Verrucomicrobia bacterium]|nr:MAG: hypothetical protein DME73_01490 [Verrucomicrobiota bacterium]
MTNATYGQIFGADTRPLIFNTSIPLKIILLRDRRRFGGSLDKFGALAMAGVSGPNSGGLKSRRESLADCPPCQSIRKTVRRSLVDAIGKVKAGQTQTSI